MRETIFTLSLTALVFSYAGAAVSAGEETGYRETERTTGETSLETQAEPGEYQPTMTESQTEGTPTVGLVRGNLSGDAGAGTDEPDKPSAGVTM